MRVEYVVAKQGRRWSVRRGATSPLHYESRDQAVQAAENLARAAAAAGESAVVRLVEDGVPREHRSFAPDGYRAR